MKNSTVQVESLDSRSKCVSRNGTYQISEVVLEESGDGMVSMSFVSKRLNRHLNAGATISASDMDRLAALWMQLRWGRVKKSGNRIKDLVTKLHGLAEELEREA